jgi:hypothetical protein
MFRDVWMYLRVGEGTTFMVSSGIESEEEAEAVRRIGM